MYSVFQGQDSVALEADVELGGTDQIFNLIMGRHMQKMNGREGQAVLTLPLLLGTDGVKKMSKSYGNYIGLSEPAKEIYGKVMSVSDALMYSYYELLTSENMDAVRALHPMEAKKKLAGLMVERFYNKEEAAKAKEGFEQVFSKKENPDDMPAVKVPGGVSWAAFLAEQGMAKSKNDARRLIEQGAVKLDGEKLEKDGPAQFKDGAVLQAGKRNFRKLLK
jgi:tyrosyl-tRNA synthetase